MPIPVSHYLRSVLHLDAAVSGAAGLLMLAGASFLGPLLELPIGLLRWAGVALVPFVIMLTLVARRETVSRMVLFDIIAINALWVAASLAILLTGAVSPNVLGYAFVIAQALAVALFAELQFLAYRRGARAVTA